MKKERYGRITSGKLHGQLVLVTNMIEERDRTPIYTMGDCQPRTYMSGRRILKVDFIILSNKYDTCLEEEPFSLMIEGVDGAHSYSTLKNVYLKERSEWPLTHYVGSVTCSCMTTEMEMIHVIEPENTSYISLLKTEEEF